MTPSRDRYSAPAGPEAEFQPGSRGRVLKNKLGISSIREMDAAEYEAFVHVQEVYVHRVSSETRLTSNLIRQMHKDWLGEIYPWAGNYRTVNVSKVGFAWPPAYRVADLMQDFERNFLTPLTPCRTGSVRDVALSMAKVHGEFLVVHPFREGNGRTARWIADIMAIQADLPLPSYNFSGRGSPVRRKLYLAAVKRSYVGNYEPLCDFFEEALVRAGG